MAVMHKCLQKRCAWAQALAVLTLLLTTTLVGAADSPATNAAALINVECAARPMANPL